MMNTRLYPALLFLLLGFSTAAAWAGSHVPIEAFFGHYQGSAVSAAGDEVSKRDIAVTLKHYRKGFSLKWITITKRQDGSLKRKEHAVNFVSSGTQNVFASAMRTNVFGKAIPMDPLKGDPYVWATLAGKTLTVHALVVTEDFGYEMQTYARTLVDGGMTLVFSRIKDGVRLKEITGTLVKTDD
ncbi:MAG: hypothetical protein GKR94_21965 [Gammaproteobacteria bacterium]|nr:hypothetical protein [Gammaproteobacteria bacterium]